MGKLQFVNLSDADRIEQAKKNRKAIDILKSWRKSLYMLEDSKFEEDHNAFLQERISLHKFD